MEPQKGCLPREIVNKLQSQWGLIKQNVHMREIVDYLIENGILTFEEWEDLKKKFPGEKDKTEEFLQVLMRRPRKSYEIFLEALKRANYFFIVERLEGPPMKKRPSQETFRQTSGDYNLGRQNSNNSEDLQNESRNNVIGSLVIMEEEVHQLRDENKKLKNENYWKERELEEVKSSLADTERLLSEASTRISRMSYISTDEGQKAFEDLKNNVHKEISQLNTVQKDVHKELLQLNDGQKEVQKDLSQLREELQQMKRLQISGTIVSDKSSTCQLL